MSDGTSTLFFLDPETFDEVGRIEVYAEGPVNNLNELEYVNGKIYANIWKENVIAIINPQTGDVSGWIDLGGIPYCEMKDTDNVLNGIAYDAKEDRLFVTGKRWPVLYEIKIDPS
jgi:glutaminyl-peptide cyclotransferase